MIEYRTKDILSIRIKSFHDTDNRSVLSEGPVFMLDKFYVGQKDTRNKGQRGGKGKKRELTMALCNCIMQRSSPINPNLLFKEQNSQGRPIIHKANR